MRFYFLAKFKTNYTFWNIQHSSWDYGSSHGRLIDAIALIREMTEDKFGKEAEEQCKLNFISFFGSDGLSYRRSHIKENAYIEKLDCRYEKTANMIDQRAVLLGLTTWYLTTGEELIVTYAERMCSKLKDIAIKERDYWYYPASEYTKHG